jgi:regulator of protease activity HflC (stomatin/prohibitin superfamily)
MNWLATLIEFLERFWPLEIVYEWEAGVFFIFGHAMRWRLGPGMYPFIPWFMHIEKVDVVSVPFSTPLQRITLDDASTLTYSATAIVQIVDPYKAVCAIADYRQSTGERVLSMISEKLAEIDTERLKSGSRKRLRTMLTKETDKDTQEFGVTVQDIRFANFAINQRSYHLLMDSAITGTGI